MSIWEFGYSLEAASRALVLAEGLMYGPAGTGELSRPFSVEYGVWGVGLFATNNKVVVPAVFVDGGASISSLAAHPLTEYPQAVAAIAAAFGQSLPWQDAVRAVPVSPMQFQADAGDYVKAGMQGQLGVPVQWAGKRGFLTAGHVGKAIKTAAYDSTGLHLGTVVFVRAPPPGRTPSPDIAVIEIGASIPCGNKLGITSPAKAGPQDAVTVHARSGPKKASIAAFSSYVYLKKSNVTVSDVYQTNNGVTVGGDSGGPVLTAKGAHIIGHIVGGGSATSCIQELDHQLNAIRSDPAFASIQV